jgi:hypothetical protein
VNKKKILVVAGLIVIIGAASFYYLTRPTSIRSLHREGHPACGSTIQVSGEVIGWPTLNLYEISENPKDPKDVLSKILVKPAKFADLPMLFKTITVTGTVECGQYGVGQIDEVSRILD